MSNARAIAAVTSTLRNLLLTQVPNVDTELSDLEVTANPPDLARKAITKAQINLFLYNTLVSAALRGFDRPPQVRPGESAWPPLALNLHFLLTAYGRGESDNDALSHSVLGAAMLVLHDHPLLGSAEIAAALPGNDLGGQAERVRISALPMSVEELSKLWTVFQTPYRISAAYEVTVVLIDSRRPLRAPLPVLKRGETDRGPEAAAGRAPSLGAIELPDSQPAIRLGEELVLTGDHLAAGDSAVFTSLRLEGEIAVTPAGLDEAGGLRVPLADAPADPQAASRWHPGYFTVSLRRDGGGGIPPVSSNALPVALAPRITATPLTAGVGTVFLTVQCTPRIRAGQRVLLVFGDRQIAPATMVNPGDATQPTSLTFSIPEVTEPGDYVLRLRVDGVDSLPVVRTGSPPLPGFDPLQTLVVS